MSRIVSQDARFRLTLLRSTALALTACIALSAPVLASEECGTGTSVACDSGDADYPSFANGISYDPVADLTLVVTSGAAITPASGIEGIDIDSSGGSVNVTLESGSTITTAGFRAEGLFVYNAASVSIDSAAAILTQGLASSGVFVEGTDGDVDILLSNGGLIETLESGSHGVQVTGSTGNVSLFLDQDTSLRTAGFFSHGVYVINSDEDVSIIVSQGSSIETDGQHSTGLRVFDTAGDVSVLTSGTIQTAGIRAHGIDVGTTYGNLAVTSSGTITTFGDSSYGIYLNFNYGAVSLNASANITTHGDNAAAIFVYAANETDMDISHSGRITTSGAAAHGIYVYGASWGNSPGSPLTITTSSASSITTSGEGAHGIYIANIGAIIGDVSLDLAGTIDVQGADGVYVRDALGAVDIDISGSISAGSGNAAAIRIKGDSNVTIDSTGTIEGAVITGDGDDYFTNAGTLRTSFVDMGEGTDRLINSGMLELAGTSGSIVNLESFTHSGIIDLANGRAGDSLSISGDFIANGGAIRLDVALDSGSADLVTLTTSGDDADGIRIANYGDSITSVNLKLAGSIDVQGTGAAIRIIGDNDATLKNTGLIDGMVILGDGDDQFTNGGTLRTSFVDMGGGDDTLINSGTLELSGASGIIDNVESFTHSGIIDLANGTAGDSLSISGDFVSGGGELHLDVSFDTGTADLLTLASVADSTNPTLIYVTDVGSGGPPLYPILLIDAAGDASDGSAFTLASTVTGAYEYQLSYDAAAFDWYLKALTVYSGTAEYPALLSGALLAWQADIPALHERLQALHWSGDGDAPRIEPAAWTGTFGTLRPWLQLTGTRQEIGGGAAYDLGATKLQAGLDMTLPRANGARYSIGGFAGIGQATQDFASSASEAEEISATGALRMVY